MQITQINWRRLSKQQQQQNSRNKILVYNHVMSCWIIKWGGRKCTTILQPSPEEDMRTTRIKLQRQSWTTLLQFEAEQGCTWEEGLELRQRWRISPREAALTSYSVIKCEAGSWSNGGWNEREGGREGELPKVTHQGEGGGPRPLRSSVGSSGAQGLKISLIANIPRLREPLNEASERGPSGLGLHYTGQAPDTNRIRVVFAGQVCKQAGR